MKTKNTFTLTIILGLLLSLVLACKNPLVKFVEPEGKCAADSPKLKTADEYAKRGLEGMISGSECSFSDCRTALELDPKNAPALACRGYGYRKRGKLNEAEDDFDEAIRLEPGNPMFFYQRSQLYRDKKQYDKALTDINATFTDSPGAYDFAARAEIYAEKKDFGNAVKDFTEAIRLKPEKQEFYKNRAESYRQLGQTDLVAADERKYEELQAAEAAADKSKKDSRKTAEEKIAETILNDEAVSLPKPVYPVAAKTVRASGEVKVQIAVDAKGNVKSAKAVSGHPFLRASAEQSARTAKFKPVEADGILIFNFTAQ
jgi:TonB family protein